MLILAGAVATSIAVPTSASADTPYNTVLDPGQTKEIAREAIWGNAKLQGTQNPIYSGGGNGVSYIIEDTSGNQHTVRTCYCNRVEFDFNLNSLGKTFVVKAKNLYKGTRVAVRIIGTFID
ncbi:hypothetical protein [Sutcliffiella rhizosphaerae]|uniref:Uncharacterized protein n=1 Tax=Sutcliffiella rhizosphaerae TaxID=2880967 RepID=A0ABM8YSD8_9BACI|nr:hypothetical protein [Sutcliffiella rhizosphaerae]CAG9622772.1 hypothetical protein BACCIP111883_03563 [Sutcliffiella rhizosphaerae]